MHISHNGDALQKCVVSYVLYRALWLNYVYMLSLNYSFVLYAFIPRQNAETDCDVDLCSLLRFYSYILLLVLCGIYWIMRFLHFWRLALICCWFVIPLVILIERTMARTIIKIWKPEIHIIMKSRNRKEEKEGKPNIWPDFESEKRQHSRLSDSQVSKIFLKKGN